MSLQNYQQVMIVRQARIDQNLQILRDRIEQAEMLSGKARSTLLEMLGRSGNDNPRFLIDPEPNNLPPPQSLLTDEGYQMANNELDTEELMAMIESMFSEVLKEMRVRGRKRAG